MVEYFLASTAQRRFGALRRVVELAAVLFMVLIGTFLHLGFGWVALLFPAPSDKPKRVESVVFPANVETSEEF